MADKIRKIVSPEGIKETKNELAYLFRSICWELGIGPNEWEYKLRKYLELTEASIPRNAKDRSYARGNLNAQLMDKKMTWTTFMRGLKFLGVTKINFAVTLTHPSGKTSEHRMGIRTRLTADDLSLAESEVSLPNKVPAGKGRFAVTLVHENGKETTHSTKLLDPTLFGEGNVAASNDDGDDGSFNTDDIVSSFNKLDKDTIKEMDTIYGTSSKKKSA